MRRELRRLAGAAFALSLQGKRVTAGSLSGQLGVGTEEAARLAGEATSEGVLTKKGRELTLTPLGRRAITVVMIGGGFEVVHLGHLHTIEEAKSLGDVLVISVARDVTIRRRKGREPIAGELDRVRLLSSLRQVDAAIIGDEKDIYKTMERVRPDVVAIGYDQYHQESEITQEGKTRGVNVRVVRLGSPVPRLKTSGLPADV